GAVVRRGQHGRRVRRRAAGRLHTGRLAADRVRGHDAGHRGGDAAGPPLGDPGGEQSAPGGVGAGGGRGGRVGDRAGRRRWRVPGGAGAGTAGRVDHAGRGGHLPAGDRAEVVRGSGRLPGQCQPGLAAGVDGDRRGGGRQPTRGAVGRPGAGGDAGAGRRWVRAGGGGGGGRRPGGSPRVAL